MATQSAAPGGLSFFEEKPDRLDLQFLRASGLAQARLQLAVLSGNRRRALEQIDRLVSIDKQLERMVQGREGPVPDPKHLEGELLGERLAISSEKLALTSEIHLPRLEAAFGAGMGLALAPEEDVEIVEDAALKSRLLRVMLWGSGFLVLVAGVTAAAMTQLL